jgi:hypothetical protein
MNKFDAADRFKAGLKRALLFEGPSMWDDNIWKDGFNLGRSFRPTLIDAVNACLVKNGYEEIQVIKLAAPMWIDRQNDTPTP